MIKKDLQIYKFSLYGFLKNLRFFEPFIILFFREMGISFLQIGLLYSIRELTTNIVEIPSGMIADKFGRKLAMIMSFCFYILAFSIFYFFPQFWFYALAMVVYGFAEAFRSGTHKAMIFDYLKLHNWQDKKVEYYGFTRSWSQFGSAVSALIAAIIVFYSGSYRYIFLFSIVPYLFNLALMISYPNSLNQSHTKHKASTSDILKDFMQLFKLSTLRKAILNSTLFDGVFKSTKDYLQPILVAMISVLVLFPRFSEEQNLAIAVGLIYFILFFLSGIAARKAYKFRKIFPSLAFSIDLSFVIGMVVIFLAGVAFIFHLQIISVLMLVLLYVLQNLRRPLNIDLISELIPQRIMASGLSLESQGKTLAVAIFAPIMGWAVDSFGIGYGFIILAVILIIMSPLVWVRSRD